MIERSRGLCFPGKTSFIFAGNRNMLWKELQCYCTLKLGILGFVYDTHTAAAEEVLPNPLDGFHGPTIAEPERVLTIAGGDRVVPTPTPTPVP